MRIAGVGMDLGSRASSIPGRKCLTAGGTDSAVVAIGYYGEVGLTRRGCPCQTSFVQARTVVRQAHHSPCHPSAPPPMAVPGRVLSRPGVHNARPGKTGRGTLLVPPRSENRAVCPGGSRPARRSAPQHGGWHGHRRSPCPWTMHGCSASSYARRGTRVTHWPTGVHSVRRT